MLQISCKDNHCDIKNEKSSAEMPAELFLSSFLFIPSLVDGLFFFTFWL
jgi:hypothetical protein